MSMLEKLEESFRSLVNKTSENDSYFASYSPAQKKRSLEGFEDEPVAKRPRLTPVTVDHSTKERRSSFAKLFSAGRASVNRLTSWLMNSFSEKKDTSLPEVASKPPKPQYYYQPSPVVGGNYSGHYPSMSLSRPPGQNARHGEYRTVMNQSLSGVAMGGGVTPKIPVQPAWGKNDSGSKVSRRQFVKNSTGVPFIQSGYSTPYRPMEEKVFNMTTNANRSNNRPPPSNGISGARESYRLLDKKRYEEMLKSYTKVPFGHMCMPGITSKKPSLFSSIFKKQSENVNNGKPVEVDLCDISNVDITFNAESPVSNPMNLTRWESKLRAQRSPSPITQQPKKSSIDPPVSTPIQKNNVTRTMMSHEIGAKSPFVADFQKASSESRFQEDLSFSLNNDKLRRERLKMELQHFKEENERWEKEMTLKIKTVLTLSTPETGVAEHVYEESEPEEEEVDEFPELSTEAEAMISRAWRSGPSREILSEGFRLQITRADMSTLAGLNWLNDEIINFYMELIKDRSEAENRPKVHPFNTFFYPKIAQSGQQSVRRWTKRVNIFEKDLLLIPVHLGMHWCLCVVNFNEKAVKFYDSMKSNGDDILRTVKKYLEDEKKEKLGEVFDTNDWSFVTVKDIPPQLNGSDCGVFTCKYADYISLNKRITFTQKNMPYFRRRMVYEIMAKKLLLS